MQIPIIKSEKIRKIIDKFILPIVLFALPLVTVNQGVDVSDSTYSLGNYLFADRLEGMWVISTYLSNLFGSFIVRLPGGSALLWANIYTGIILAITVIGAFYSLKKDIGTPAAFFGGVVAIEMCWIPTGILYNYLSYLFLTVGALLLYKAVTKENRKLLFAAGLVLGINVFVRIPNITDAALILVLWTVALYEKREFKTVAKDTGICIGGYVVGVVLPLIAVVFKFGLKGLADMVDGLSAITSTDETYTPIAMILGTMRAYSRSSKWFFIIMLVVLGGIVLFRILPSKVTPLKVVIYLAVIGLMVRFFWGRGMFSFRYYEDYSSIYEWGMISLYLSITSAAYGLIVATRKNEANRRKFIALSVMSLVITVIAPLGSNNYTYQNLNNLFVVMPVTFYLCIDAVRRIAKKGKDFFTFPVGIMLLALGVIIIVQGFGFNSTFVFRDGMRGEERNAKIDGIPSLKGMCTNSENATNLLELYNCIEEINPDEVILYGDCPGLTYILGRPSALFTSWADLDSNPVELVAEGLEKIADRKGIAVIIRNIEPSSKNYEKKLSLIYDFIDENDYRECFKSDEYVVYTR